MNLSEIINKIIAFFKKAYNYFSGKQFEKAPIVPVIRIEYDKYDYNQLDIDINKEVNKIRTDLGLNALEISPDVCDIAFSHCKYMVDNGIVNHAFFYERSQQIILRGASIVSENVAYNFSSAKSFANAWKNSPGHYANIIKAKYTHTGIAHLKDANGKIYAVQLFFKY